MAPEPDTLLAGLTRIVATELNRPVALQRVADVIKSSGSYRWVGLYDVDRMAGVVRNIVWSGPGPPEHPTFPITKGLTGAAIAGREAVNVGDVTADPRYLTALNTTRSEIIVPIFDKAGESVVGTIDVESEIPNAFSIEAQEVLERCADVIRPLWKW
ncbi:MAG TPA: GAF domain-containing protein [Terriglobia bacterium]|nr:GAF domain-containing protein [Terriglobia bacterium]